MTFIDKLNILTAKTAGKVNDAVESGKLSMKIAGEEKKVKDATNQICKLVMAKLDAGDEMDEEIKKLYAVIVTARGEIETAKAEQEAFKPAFGVTCPSCKTKNACGMKFCGSCGAKLEA